MYNAPMNTLTDNEMKQLVEALESLYPDAKCALEYDTVYHLLCAVMLSAQTTDKSVNKVTPELFARYPEPADLAAAPVEELEALIRSIGMYRTKAKNLKAMSRLLAAEFDGQVPHSYEALVSLPGVGRKTANVVLAEGFGEQRIAVDTHVFRLANRIGITAEKDVTATELSLMKRIPEDHWTAMHHALIYHGRQVCNARRPACETCGIAHLCHYKREL